MTGSLFGPDTLLGPEPALLIGGRRVTTGATRPVEDPATGSACARGSHLGSTTASWMGLRS